MARKTTRLFFSGNSQAVRIPREFQLEGDEVEIHRKGNTLVLKPKKKSWSDLKDSLKKFTPRLHGKGTPTASRTKAETAFS